MLYAFGDSVTYGYNFDEGVRENLVYPALMSQKLNVSLINTALPGGSNWRIARLLQSISLNENDTVIISWTEPTRFEFGVSPMHYAPPIRENRIGDLLECDGDLISKRFFIQLTQRTTDQYAKTLNGIIYNEFNNELWFAEMFKVMYNSCLNVLNESGCKWIMFNAWAKQADGVFHDNYIYSDTTMDKIIGNPDGYWNTEQHYQVSNIILDKLKEIYG